MINHQYKFIFIHFPSTGGTSIESALGGESESLDCSFIQSDYLRRECEKAYLFNDCLFKHISPEIAKELYAPYWNEYFKFSFVRNPWSWLASLWSKGPRRRKGKNFTSWLKSPELAPHESQSPFDLCDQLSGVDFIGRFESLGRDFNNICAELNIPHTELPHKQQNHRKHYSKYYNSDSQYIVSKLYAKDIEYFGYKFGE